MSVFSEFSVLGLIVIGIISVVIYKSIEKSGSKPPAGPGIPIIVAGALLALIALCNGGGY